MNCHVLRTSAEDVRLVLVALDVTLAVDPGAQLQGEQALGVDTPIEVGPTSVEFAAFAKSTWNFQRRRLVDVPSDTK